MLRYHGQMRRGAVKSQWDRSNLMVAGESLTERQRRGMKMLCAQALKAAANHDHAKKLGLILTAHCIVLYIHT
jgi:hypothetical protein